MVIIKGFNLQSLTDSFGELRLNIISDQTVNFLDLEISICKIKKRLYFKLYIKSTNTFCYLPIDSNHPPFIFDNIPKSIFMRPRRICTSYSDFLYFCRLFLNQLVKRGYNFNILLKTMFMVSILKRESLLIYKEKNEYLNENNLTFKFPFDFNFIGIKDIIIDSFNNIKNNYCFLKDKKIKIVNYIQPNLGRLLVHNFPFNFDNYKFFKYLKCSNLRCNVCLFGHGDYFIKILNNFYLPLCINSSCDSEGIVYIIYCNLCTDVFYIGESGRSVKQRISEHIRDIKNFKAYYNFKNVSFHFNLLGHNYLHHFSFFIFIKNCMDKNIRLYFETLLIYIFKNYNMKLLNDKKDCIITFKKFKDTKFNQLFNFIDD